MPLSLRVGVDIGGTFTDIVVLGSDGSIHTKKVSSSVGDYARAIVDGLAELFAETGLSGGAIEEIRHGTTVASNAILEHKGARVGLITTKGFRDVLEIRTLRMPRLYDLTWTKPPPLVERYLRKVVDERERMARVLVELGVRPAVSEANFLWIRTPVPAQEVQSALGERGILVRSFPQGGRLSHQLRVTVGKPFENDHFLVAMAEILRPG